MKNGGKRKGAGRKKLSSTIQADMYRKFLYEEVLKHKDEIIAALIAKAIKGDVLALREINDRVLGKAQERVDLTSGGEPIPLLGGARKR